MQNKLIFATFLVISFVSSGCQAKSNSQHPDSSSKQHVESVVVATSSTAFAMGDPAMYSPVNAVDSKAKELSNKSEKHDDPPTGKPQNQSYYSLKTRYFPYPGQGVMLGQGWDSFSGRPVGNNCIVFSRQVIPGHDLNIETQEIKSRYQLNTAMKMSMSASYSGYGFSGNAKASYSQSLDIDQNSTNILATVNVWKGDEFVAPSVIARASEDFPKPGESSFYGVSLTDEAIEALKPKKGDAQTPIQRFRQMCGDSYVGHIRNGASLYAYLNYESLTREQKKAMAASISASGYGAKVSGSYESSEREKIENSRSNISIFQTGGFLNATPMNIADFKKTVSAFTQSSDPNYFPVKPFEVGLMSYASLPNWPQKNRLTNPDSMLEIITLYWLFDDLRKNYIKALQFANQFAIIDLAAHEGDLIMAHTDLVCTYKQEVISVETSEDTKPASRSKKWILQNASTDACPLGEDLWDYVNADLRIVRKNLAEITVMQTALRETIDSCRNPAAHTESCNSKDRFDAMTAVLSGRAEELGSATEVVPTISGEPSLAALYETYEFIKSSNGQNIESLLQQDVESRNIQLKLLEDKILEAFPTDAERADTFRYTPQPGVLRASGLNSLNIAVFDNANYSEVRKYYENESLLLEKISETNDIIGVLSAAQMVDESSLSNVIVSGVIREADLPDVWPFGLFKPGNATISIKTAENHWSDMVDAYYHYLVVLPIRLKTSQGTAIPLFSDIVDNTVDGAIQSSSENTAIIRKVKLDSLLGTSESFCDVDIVHKLCRPLDRIIEDLNQANLATFSTVTAKPGKLNRGKRRCKLKLVADPLPRYKYKCKSAPDWRDPTTYIINVIGGNEIDL